MKFAERKIKTLFLFLSFPFFFLLAYVCAHNAYLSFLLVRYARSANSSYFWIDLFYCGGPFSQIFPLSYYASLLFPCVPSQISLALTEALALSLSLPLLVALYQRLMPHPDSRILILSAILFYLSPLMLSIYYDGLLPLLLSLPPALFALRLVEEPSTRNIALLTSSLALTLLCAPPAFLSLTFFAFIYLAVRSLLNHLKHEPIHLSTPLLSLIFSSFLSFTLTSFWLFPFLAYFSKVHHAFPGASWGSLLFPSSTSYASSSYIGFFYVAPVALGLLLRDYRSDGKIQLLLFVFLAAVLLSPLLKPLLIWASLILARLVAEAVYRTYSVLNTRYFSIRYHFIPSLSLSERLRAYSIKGGAILLAFLLIALPFTDSALFLWKLPRERSPSLSVNGRTWVADPSLDPVYFASFSGANIVEGPQSPSFGSRRLGEFLSEKLPSSRSTYVLSVLRYSSVDWVVSRKDSPYADKVKSLGYAREEDSFLLVRISSEYVRPYSKAVYCVGDALPIVPITEKKGILPLKLGDYVELSLRNREEPVLLLNFKRFGVLSSEERLAELLEKGFPIVVFTDQEGLYPGKFLNVTVSVGYFYGPKNASALIGGRLVNFTLSFPEEGWRYTYFPYNLTPLLSVGGRTVIGYMNYGKGLAYFVGMNALEYLWRYGNPYVEEVLASVVDAISVGYGNLTASVVSIEKKPGFVKFKVRSSSTSPFWIIVCESYDECWKASGGREIVEAVPNFMALRLEGSEEYEVVLKAGPVDAHFTGAFLSILGCLAVLFLYWYGEKAIKRLKRI